MAAWATSHQAVAVDFHTAVVRWEELATEAVVEAGTAVVVVTDSDRSSCVDLKALLTQSL